MEFFDTARSETRDADPINWGLVLALVGCLCFWAAVVSVIFAAV